MANITLKPITAEDVLVREAQGIAREVIHGKWADYTEMAGKRHGEIGTNLIAGLHPFVKQHKLGKVYQDNTTYVLEGTPDNIITSRIPDVSFVAAARVDTSDPGFYYQAPDLAIEIVSPSETRRDTEEKVTDFLRFGTQQVWVIYPDEQRVWGISPAAKSIPII